MPPLITQVSESVWCVQRRAYLSCSYVVVRPSGTVLVDAGIDPEGRDMLAALTRLELPVEGVRAILVTHWHNDHSSGVAAIAEASGAEVYYHSGAAGRMTRNIKAEGCRGRFGAILPETGWLSPLRGLVELAPQRGIAASRHVEEGERLLDEFLVMATPGHSAGHLSFWFEPERVLFAGDALAVAKDHVAFMSRWLTEDVDAARQSMIRCLELAPAAICPGHRYPLLNPSAEALAGLREQLQAGCRWPIYGC